MDQDPFAPLTADEQATQPTEAPRREKLKPIMPVPEGAPSPASYAERGRPDAMWMYRNPQGRLLCAVARWDVVDASGLPEKEIRPLTYCEDETGSRAWKRKTPPYPRPLYGQDRLAQRPQAPVLVVEGEKTCEAAQRLYPDLVSTTWMGGADAVDKADWVDLMGRDVTLLGDPDEAGRRAIDAVARQLRSVGAKAIKIVELPPGAPEGWDVADPLPDGWSAEMVRAAIDSAQVLAAIEGSGAAPAEVCDTPQASTSATIASHLPPEALDPPSAPEPADTPGVVVRQVPDGTIAKPAAQVIRFPHVGRAGPIAGQSEDPQKVENGDVGAAPEAGYQMDDDGIYWTKATGEGPVTVQLTNFAAEIVGEIERDDGAERTRTFELEAHHRGRKRRFHVGAAEFAGMSWVPRELGATAAVYPGYSVKDHARFAIQAMSDAPDHRTIYAHTGWIEVDGKPVYLHGGGAVGADGVVDGIETDLGAVGLDRCQLEVAADLDALRMALRASLAFLDLGPRRITMPLYAAIWRSVLAPADFSMFVVGPTGTFKSQTAGLAQQHFGAGFDANHLPGSWMSTANALEAVAFGGKDMLTVIDDYAPSGTRQDVAKLDSQARRVLRAQGNNAGRQRMRPDGTLRPPKPPRGLILNTGEDLPTGQSILARSCIVEVRQGDIAPAKLTQCQLDAAAGLYAVAMGGWLQWLARDLNGARARFAKKRDEERASIRTGAGHARTPWLLGDLMAAFDLFLSFAEDVGTTDTAMAEWLRAEARKTLMQIGRDQGAHQKAEEPGPRFLAMIRGALAAGRAHLGDAARPAGPPAAPEQFGWRSTSDEQGSKVWRAGGDLIGWADGHLVHLQPEAAYRAAEQFAGGSGQSLAIGMRALWSRLKDSGLLAQSDVGRNTLKKRIGGRQENTIAIAVSVLGGEAGTSGTGEDAEEHQGAVLDLCSHSAPGTPANGNDVRELGAGDEGQIGDVPEVPDTGDDNVVRSRPKGIPL